MQSTSRRPRALGPVHLGLGLVLLTGWGDALYAQNDQIFDAKGTPRRGVISSITPAEIEINVNGTARKFATNEIKKVTFGDEPGELRTARDNAQNGQLEDALTTLRQIAPQSIERAAVRAELEFYLAYCKAKLAMRGQGDQKDAARELYAFWSRNPDSFHHFEASRLLGDISMTMGLFDGAQRFYAALGKAPWPETKMEARVLEAKALRGKEDYAGALALYEQLLSSGLTTAEAARQKLYAEAGKAACLAETGKPEEGIKLCQDLISKNDPKDAALFAQTYNALGRGHLKLNQVDEALLAFLHTHTLFFSEAEAHAEALYFLIGLWEKAQQPDRALRARGLLRERYAGSTWASK